jgi:hypothetical protein
MGLTQDVMGLTQNVKGLIRNVRGQIRFVKVVDFPAIYINKAEDVVSRTAQMTKNGKRRFFKLLF